MATWVIDPAHTVVEFAVRHMMISTVKGRFGKVEGRLEGEPADLTGARVEVTIDAASVDTREEQRDGHLRSADFFDVEHHPTITFRSRRIEPKGEGRYRLTGDLTIRGVTREVGLDLVFEGVGKDPWGNQRAGFSVEGRIDRRDFGLTWNAALELGGVLVGDEVRISVAAELIRQEQAA